MLKINRNQIKIISKWGKRDLSQINKARNHLEGCRLLHQLVDQNKKVKMEKIRIKTKKTKKMVRIKMMVKKIKRIKRRINKMIKITRNQMFLYLSLYQFQRVNKKKTIKIKMIETKTKIKKKKIRKRKIKKKKTNKITKMRKKTLKNQIYL